MKNEKDKKVIIQFNEKRRSKMGQHSRNIDRLSDAMRTLDELASQEKEEIKELLSSQFGNLRKALTEVEPEVRKTLEHTSERFANFASEAKEATKEKAKQIGRDVDSKVHEMPWTFMGASAAAGILAGYYLGNYFSRRSANDRRA